MIHLTARGAQRYGMPHPHPRTIRAAIGLVLALAGCVRGGEMRGDDKPGETRAARPDPPALAAAAPTFLDTLQERTFRYFWNLTDPHTGLTPDRAPARSFASIAATGFALTAYPIGIERGYVRREDGRRRVLTTLRFLWTAPQDSTPHGPTGYRGFFYHFVDPETGQRFEDVELSTVDTALLMAGVLFVQSYFDRPEAAEDSVRALAESLYARVDWKWLQVRPPALAHGWKPGSGFLPWDWRGYNEAMILQVLALGAPRHAVGPETWTDWCSTYAWGEFHGQEHIGFAPLFGHQYSHVWIDFRGIRDAYMRGRGIDYFENSERAVRSQQAYAVANPMGWASYGERCWGLSACDGPVDGTFAIHDQKREFHTYWARGASFNRVSDDGTLCPSAVAASLPFAPEIVLPALDWMRQMYGTHLFSTYGFLDAFNPTFQLDVRIRHGKVVPGLGWFDTDYLGIDQGPILAMIENHRTRLVWEVMRRNPHIVRGLRAAGFTGGWLDSAAAR
jgi:hypothetical protein